MTEAQTSPPMPIWAKLLLWFFLVGMAACFIVGSYFAYWLGTFKEHAVDPKAIAITLDHIGHIQQLPPGFQAEAAFPLPPVNIYALLLKHSPEDSEYWLFRMPDPGTASAQQLVDEGAQMASQKHGTRMTVTQRGTENVAGQQMAWAQGPTTTAGGTAAQQFVGIVVLKDTHETVRLLAITPGDRFNMDNAKQLLASIKKF